MFLFAQESQILYFDFAKDVPKTSSSSELNQWIESNKTAEIFKIEGFCDSVDTNLFNKKLASKRIQNVLKTLKFNNISISKTLEEHSFGEDFEQDTIQDNNRKVIIYYQIQKVSEMREKVNKLNVGEKLNLKGLNFYNFSDVVLPKSIPILEELLELMLEKPTLSIEIQGHICCMKEEQYTTSTDRAKTVYRYLINNGIKAERLSYIGFGSTQPIYTLPEKNEEQRVANRRVEIRVVSK